MGAIERWLAQTGQVPQATSRTPGQTTAPEGAHPARERGADNHSGDSILEITFGELLKTSIRPPSRDMPVRAVRANADTTPAPARASAPDQAQAHARRDTASRSAGDRDSKSREGVTDAPAPSVTRNDAAPRRSESQARDVNRPDRGRFSGRREDFGDTKATDREDDAHSPEPVNVYGGQVSSTQAFSNATESQPVEEGTASVASAALQTPTTPEEPEPPPAESVSEAFVADAGTGEIHVSSAGFEGLIETIPLAEATGSVDAESATRTTGGLGIDIPAEIRKGEFVNAGIELAVPPVDGVAEPALEGLSGNTVGTPADAEVFQIETAEGAENAPPETRSVGPEAVASTEEAISVDTWSTVLEVVLPRVEEAESGPQENLSTRKTVEETPEVVQPQVDLPVVSRTPEPQLPVAIPLLVAIPEATDPEQPATPSADSAESLRAGSPEGTVSSTQGRSTAAPGGIVAGLVQGLWGGIERQPIRISATESPVVGPEVRLEESLDTWSGLTGLLPSGTDADPAEPTIPAGDRSSAVGGSVHTSTKPSALGAHATVEPGASTEPRVDQRDLIQRQILPGLTTARGEGRAVVLRLDPPELGALRVQISVRERSVVAVLEVERRETRQLLGDSLPQLREALQQQGFGIDRIEVSLADGRLDDQHSTGSGGFGGGQSGRREQGEPGVAPPVENPASGSKRSGSPVPKPHINPVKSGIDVQV